MFRFENGAFLYALVLIPILILFFTAAWTARKQALRRFGSLHLVKRLMPLASNTKHLFKFILLMFGLFFLIIGWANPQWGTKKEKVKRKSVDIFVALDISQSMMAEDISPSRLERAKRFAQDLVDALKGERLGMIIFAGNAYLQVPLTTDYAAVQLFIKSANPQMAPTQGTAIVEAVDLAERSFDEENKQQKVLIVISDGENHDDEALERAKKARDDGLLIFTVGVGTSEGSFIPIYEGGQLDYKRDATDNPVRSQLNEVMLQELAEAGDGDYFNLLSGSEQVANVIQTRIDGMEKRELEQRIFTEYESYFQYFLGLGLLFLLVEFLISYRRNKYLEWERLFGERE